MFIASLSLALAQSVPSRQIPATVMAEVQRLQSDFELALSADCDADRCFPTGCVYVDHAVADQPREGSLPGLGLDPGPGSVQSQEYLTRAQCSFAHEPSLEAEDAQALVRRLQTKLSSGWTVVGVTRRELLALPTYVGEPPPVEVDTAAPEPEPEPEPLAPETAGQQLWSTLLPHTPWMVGIGLVTLAMVLLTWAFRRVGKASIEEQALLAELSREGGPPSEAAEPPEVEDSWVAEQEAAWNGRVAEGELQSLARELLRSGDMGLMAKASLVFGERFLQAFPAGGDVAATKLELAEFVKGVGDDELPDDRAFYEALNRHAAAAALATQTDTEVIRGLRERFGAGGLLGLIGSVNARLGALVFALAPTTEQHEVARLLSARQVWDLAQQLLASNRLDPAEAEAVFALVGGSEAVAAPAEVTDRGAPFDAPGALAVLLPTLEPATRAKLFEGALRRFSGRAPGWYREIFLPELLAALPAEVQVDLLLEVDVEPLAAWLSLTGPAKREVVAVMPDSLRSAVGAVSSWPSQERQLALAGRGRRELAAAFQRQLGRAGVRFEDALVGGGEA